MDLVMDQALISIISGVIQTVVAVIGLGATLWVMVNDNKKKLSH